MVSLYFNVFSSLSLSNLLPRVQLASLLNNQNSNSILNRFGIQDTVTDLLNRVGFDQTFSIGNKIGIDRPDSVLNKVELGMNNVLNLNQQGLLNPGNGGLYGGNGPGYGGGAGAGGYPGGGGGGSFGGGGGVEGGGGGISGTGSYGGGVGVSTAGGGPLGGQTNWQGSTQGSFPIGGGNRPRPGLVGYLPDGQEQFGGGGGGVANGAGAGQGQTGGSGGGMLSGILSQVGNRFGWGSSGNKNEPKDVYKQAGLVAEDSEGEDLSEWWINQENSDEYWLQESLRDVLDGGRTGENPDVVLKYLVELQIKKVISTMLEHLAQAKVKPEEQVKMNEAAEMELKKLTPDQIKRIAHDIVEREKTKMTERGRYKERTDLLRKPPTNVLSEEDLKRLLVEATKRKEILPDKDEVVKLLETTHGLRDKGKLVSDKDTSEDKLHQLEKVANKTDMNQVVQQLNQNNFKGKPSTLRREDNMTEQLDNSVGNEDHSAVNDIENKPKDPNVTTKAEINEKEVINKTSLGVSEENGNSNRPELYISEQMRNNINELLAQLTSGNTLKVPSIEKSDQEHHTNESASIGSSLATTNVKTSSSTSTTTVKTEPMVEKEEVGTAMKTDAAQSSNDTSKPSETQDDAVNLLLQRLFANANDETLKLFLPQQHHDVRKDSNQGSRTIMDNINTFGTLSQENKNILSKSSRSFRNRFDKKSLSARKPNLNGPRGMLGHLEQVGAGDSTNHPVNFNGLPRPVVGEFKIHNGSLIDGYSEKNTTSDHTLPIKRQLADEALIHLAEDKTKTKPVGNLMKRGSLFLEPPTATSRWFGRSSHRKAEKKSSLKY